MDSTRVRQKTNSKQEKPMAIVRKPLKETDIFWCNATMLGVEQNKWNAKKKINCIIQSWLEAEKTHLSLMKITVRVSTRK